MSNDIRNYMNLLEGKGFAIKSSWVGYAPGARLDPRFWSEVTKAMDELGIDKDTAGKDEVVRATEYIKKKIEDAIEAGRKLRDQADELLAKAREAEAKAPQVTGLSPKLSVPTIGATKIRK